MIHNKQHYLLYCLVLSFQAHNVSAALVSVAGSGSIANTAAFVAREAVAEVLGTGSLVANSASVASEVQAHASMDTIMSSVADVMSENVSSVSSGSSSSDSSAVEAAAEKSEALRAATTHVLQYWANNSSIISALSRTSPRAVQNALTVIPKPVAGQSPVKVPSVSEYSEALQYVTARQEYAFLKSNYGVVLPSEIEILAPMTVGDLTVIMPPVSATVDFLPKQQLYLFVNCFAEKALTTTAQNRIAEDLLTQFENIASPSGWERMKDSAKSKLVGQWCASIQKYATSIQKSIVQALQAQNAAEVQAQAGSKDLWTIFQQKYEAVRKSMISSRFDDPSLAQLCPGDAAGQNFIQLYVEGALECLVYDLTIYSSIANVGGGNGGAGNGNDIVRYVNSPNGKDMLYYMLFGAAMLGGGAALANDDEEGLKNRILATCAAVKLHVKDAEKMDPAAFVEIFAQSVCYVVTGRMLELDPVKKAQFIKVLQAAQGITQDIIQNPATVVRNVPNPVIVVGTLIQDIPQWQAYGLNFNQPIDALMSDIYDLLGQREGYAENIAAIKEALANDPNQALVVQAALFEKAKMAGGLTKLTYFGKASMQALKGLGKAMVNGVKGGEVSGGDADNAVANFVQPIVEDQKAELQQLMQQELEKVDRGQQTSDEALVRIKAALGANSAIPQVILEQLTLLKNEEIAKAEAEGIERARQEAAANKLLAAVSGSLFDDVERMQNNIVEDFAQNLEALKALELEGQQALNKVRTFVVVEKESIQGNIFQQRITGFAPALAMMVGDMRFKKVSSSDAAKVMQELVKKSNTTIWGSDRPAQNAFVQGYLQSLVFMNKAAARNVPIDISNGQVVQVVDVISQALAK